MLDLVELVEQAGGQRDGGRASLVQGWRDRDAPETASDQTAIEAFPHEKGDYMGSPQLFAEAGFEPLRNAGKRTLVRCSS